MTNGCPQLTAFFTSTPILASLADRLRSDGVDRRRRRLLQNCSIVTWDRFAEILRQFLGKGQIP